MSIPEKELYALIYSLDKFKLYLFGPQFTWITDAKCLTWLHTVKDSSPKLLRWCLQIQGIDFALQHKHGKDNIVPDAVSRVLPSILHTSDPTADATVTLASMLVLDVEPLAPLTDSSDDAAVSYSTARNLRRDREGQASVECAPTELVASVGSALPNREQVAQAQRADTFLGSILNATQRTEATSTLRHGNEYALSDRILYRLPHGKTADSAQPRLCVPSTLVQPLFYLYHSSPSG
jgi:RNase H-like domain found in reverse transcriptase